MPPTLTLSELADSLVPGRTVFMPGSAAEPTPLLELWRSDPARTRSLRLLHSFVPGINAFDMDSLDASAVVTGLFMQPAWQRAQASGRFRHLPLSYSGFVRYIGESAPVDTCVVHVAPPDAHGHCSLGPAVEFTPLVQARSRRTVALLNPSLPAMPGSAFLPLDAFDAVAEVDCIPKGYDVGLANAQAIAIATLIAGFIDDGCTVQVGLGKVPNALFALLHDRRRLRLYSGMLSDSALDLWEAGALDPAAQPTSCVWVGSPALYPRLHGLAGVVVAGCDRTHAAATLMALPKLRAVNSALSVDLFGQANLEVAGGQAISGLGGAADFARAARSAPGGLSIVALPASYSGGTRTRIVPRLDDGIASLGRTDIDVVVTEHGAADLRGLSVHERAKALVSVAEPALRDGLLAEWAVIAARL
jgi:acyl-CoA hydrolase